MTGRLAKTLRSDRAKKAYIVLALVVVLFFVCNDFLMPWYVNQGGIIEVPQVVGMGFEDAKRELDSLGLTPREGDVRADRDHPAGVVIIQNPSAGKKVNRGRRIYLTISGGELLVEVPNVRGRTIRDAHFVLEKEGLKLGVIEYEPSDEFPENTIIQQKTAAGARVKRDVYVSVVVSQGKTSEKITVPDLNGKTLAEAGKILADNGLKIGNITYQPSGDLLPNTVLGQFPRAGDLAAFGQAVDLFVVQAGAKKKDANEN